MVIDAEYVNVGSDYRIRRLGAKVGKNIAEIFGGEPATEREPQQSDPADQAAERDAAGDQ